jgi:hypothetical protein
MEALNRWIMSQDYPQDDASYEHEAMKCPAMKDWLHAWGHAIIIIESTPVVHGLGASLSGLLSRAECRDIIRETKW